MLRQIYNFYTPGVYNNYMKLEHPLIGMVIPKSFFKMFSNKDITFGSWVHSHVCIRGIENVDYTDFKHHSQYILTTWQDFWNGAVANKLRSIKPFL